MRKYGIVNGEAKQIAALKLKQVTVRDRMVKVIGNTFVNGLNVLGSNLA